MELFWFPFQLFAGGGWWIGGNQIIHFITSYYSKHTTHT
jgi:hypothetical protein